MAIKFYILLRICKKTLSGAVSRSDQSAGRELSEGEQAPQGRANKNNLGTDPPCQPSPVKARNRKLSKVNQSALKVPAAL